MRAVEPFWLDVGSFNGFNPIFNTQRGYGATPGECAFPREKCAAFDPYGKTGQGQVGGNGVGLTRQAPAGTLVWALGHLHPGGLRLDLQLERGGVRKRVLTSDANYFDPGGPLSWDMSMEVTNQDYRLGLKSGDRFVLNAVYDTTHAPGSRAWASL